MRQKTSVSEYHVITTSQSCILKNMSSMLLRTRIAVTLLLYCLCNASASPCRRKPITDSPLPISLHQTTKDNSALAGKLLLPEKDKDPCLQKNTYHARAECILPLLEAYYGRSFTMLCPRLSLILARSTCRGCPWSRINPDALPTIGKTGFPLKPAHLYFRNVTPTCLIAQHADSFKSHSSVLFRVGFLALDITLSLALISFLGDKSVAEDDEELDPVFIGRCEISEAAYLATVWFLFYGINLHTAFLNDCYRVCESLSSYYAQYMLKIATYSGALCLSFSRCLRLPHRETSNWGFVFWPKKYPRQYSKRIFGLSLVVLLLMGGLFAALLSDQFMLMYPPEPELLCFVGRKDYAMGAIQYSKLLLEFTAIIVFASNTKSQPRAERLRYACLAVIIALSWIVVFICIFTDIYEPRGHSMLIKHIMDQEIAGVGVQLVHINVISLLGLLEMLIPSFEDSTVADADSRAT